MPGFGSISSAPIGALPDSGIVIASGATLTGTSTIIPGTAQGGVSATASGATLTGASTISAGAASGGINGTAAGASLIGTSTISPGAATGDTGSQAATAAGATLTGVSTMVAGGASSGILIPNANQFYTGRTRQRLYTGGQSMNFSPKRAAETEIFAVDFAPLLAVSETIQSAVWTSTVVDGIDPSPNATISGVASISGTKVSGKITAGIPGVRYAPICTVQTSLGQTLVLPEYGHGLLLVTL